MSSRKPRSTKAVKPPKKPATRKRATVTTRQAMPVAPPAERPLLLLAGTGPLLLECVSAAASWPYAVAVYAPKDHPPGCSLPKGTRTVARPDPGASVVIECTLADADAKRARLRSLDETYGPETLMLTNALSVSVAEQASWIKGKHRLLGVGLLPGFLERPLLELAPSAMTAKQTVETAIVFFRTLGKDVEIVQDRVGMVAARIICQIINESAFALQEDVASPEDIDTSMKLGVSYPYGPFEWAERLGFDNVLTVLQALQREYQEERYRISPLLRAMAIGGTWWKRPDATAQDKEPS